MAVSVTSKGQVTIPKRVREALGITPGSKVEFDVAGGGAVKPLFEEQRESRLGHRLPLLLQQAPVADEKVGFLRRTDDFTRHYSSLLNSLPPYCSW